MEDFFFLYSLEIVNSVHELKVIRSNRNAVRWKLSIAELLLGPWHDISAYNMLWA